ncbi:MAG: hypothetical protein PHS59_17325 [Paludibacter sp.]|nr:hypothetical protein [Paludibacter sp.]
MKVDQNKIAERLYNFDKTDISKFEESFYNKSLLTRIKETNCENKKDYLKFLEENKTELTILKNSLFISYSEFFRNSLTFSLLEHEVLPALINNKIKNKQHEIRIWSAACAGGQEVYSLAILLNEMNLKDKIKVRIFATDQSEQEIERAKKGQFAYSEISGISVKRMNNWLIKEGETYRVKDELKEMIDFSTFDLFTTASNCPPASIFCDFDLVFCANILFYYKPYFRQTIIQKIRKNISIKGYLVTGETEREVLLQNNFQEVFPKSAIFKI